MEVKISKWGNSMALRLPKNLIDDLKIQEGSLLSLSIQDNKLIAEPINKKYTLSSLLESINDSNIHSEINTNLELGNEII